MRLLVLESWIHTIKSKYLANFHNAIENGDGEKIKEESIRVLKRCKGLYTSKRKYILDEIDGLIEDFEAVPADDLEELEYLVNELYDFCDEQGIFISW